MKATVVGMLTAPALLVGGLAVIAGTPDGAVTAAPSAGEQVVAEQGAAELAALQAATPKGYKLVFRDEFNGASLGSKWSSEPAITSLRPCTSTSPSAGVVREGKFLISASLDKSRTASASCPKGYFINGQFSTANSTTFKYGYFSARIKVQRESGMHAGWFVYNDPEPDPGVDLRTPKALGMELDAIEYFGDKDNKQGVKHGVQNTVYRYTVNNDGSLKLNKYGGRQDVRKITGNRDTPADGYHVYSVEWTPKGATFRMDGKVTFNYKGGLSTRAHYLILSMLTSPFEAGKLTTSELPGTMAVDWVRVYQKK